MAPGFFQDPLISVLSEKIKEEYWERFDVGCMTIGDNKIELDIHKMRLYSGFKQELDHLVYQFSQKYGVEFTVSYWDGQFVISLF